ncbi:hypothetical protein QYM36_007551 [Artemia franciscana]|uniref:Reverse transcriptase domain-containing protein n=1 Tax=Artemia franciscana TaxID=6661 RepID=A0AA88LDS2_ARTSF|nr:hypothetical protein QYM36_007551 [Artemia franciscana]
MLLSAPLKFPTSKYIDEGQQPKSLRHQDDLLKAFAKDELNVDIQNLNIPSTPGVDKVDNLWLIKRPEEFRIRILMVFNQCWLNSTFPQILKPTIIKTVFEMQKPSNDTKSYRPISILLCLGKLLEKIVYKRLEWIMEKNKLIQAEQTGFRKHHSTLDNMVRLKFFIKTGFEEGKISVEVLYDFEGAYNNGAILSTLLFLLFVSDLKTSTTVDIRGMFADNLLTYYKNNSIEEASKSAKTTLEEIHQYSKDHGVPLPTEKAKVIVFHRERNPSQIQRSG